MSDVRMVHARWDQMEVVRYDRQGKWYLEPNDYPKVPRQMVTITQAVEYALWAVAQPGGQFFFGQPGGQTFDARVRKRLHINSRSRSPRTKASS